MTDIPASATYVTRRSETGYVIDRRVGPGWQPCITCDEYGLSIAILGLLTRASAAPPISVWDADKGRFIIGDVGQLDEEAA
jgi:hypothetical protein